MEKKYIATAQEARDHAIEWQSWSSQRSMSYGELAEWESYFTRLGKQFHLTAEFRENGIL